MPPPEPKCIPPPLFVAELLLNAQFVTNPPPPLETPPPLAAALPLKVLFVIAKEDKANTAPPFVTVWLPLNEQPETPAPDTPPPLPPAMFVEKMQLMAIAKPGRPLKSPPPFLPAKLLEKLPLLSVTVPEAMAKPPPSVPADPSACASG